LNVFVSSFFTDLNDKIFGLLNDLSNSDTDASNEDKEQDHFQMKPMKQKQRNRKESKNTLNIDHVKQMGLDPSDDKDFLNELIRFYDFNLNISY